MKSSTRTLLLSTVALALGATIVTAAATRPAPSPAPAPSAHSRLQAVPLKFAKIYWEYNASANDLGVHVSLDGEDWSRLKIEDPSGHVLFQVQGRGPYANLGMTELFFEGAEPSLDEFPLHDLLALFPEGEYDFKGAYVDGNTVDDEDLFTHAIPDGPVVAVETGPNDLLRIRWSEVTSPPPGFPTRPIHIVGYQVIVEPSFEVTLPATARRVTVSPEFVQTLGPGSHAFEVLAIEESGNQTLTEGSFVR